MKLKLGDKIQIEPGYGIECGTNEKQFYKNGLYEIIKSPSGNWCIINNKTKMQSSGTINHVNPEFATQEEMNRTCGIKDFKWYPA